MKPYLLTLSLLLAVACNSFEPFTFVQMTDTQIGFIDQSPRYSHSDSLMKAAVLAANALEPAYVIVTGDLVDNPADPVQDSVYRTRLAEIEAPVYAIPGNHDYLGGFTREKQSAYIALRGYDRFSFRDKGCAFIGMDSNCIKDGVEEAEAEQWEWLSGELDAARKCKYTFCSCIAPLSGKAWKSRRIISISPRNKGKSTSTCSRKKGSMWSLRGTRTSSMIPLRKASVLWPPVRSPMPSGMGRPAIMWSA